MKNVDLPRYRRTAHLISGRIDVHAMNAFCHIKNYISSILIELSKLCNAQCINFNFQFLLLPE